MTLVFTIRSWCVILCLLSASLVWASTDREDATIRLSGDLDLSSGQQTTLGREATQGSADAARKLASYRSTVRGDRAATLKWYTIGAETAVRAMRADFSGYFAIVKMKKSAHVLSSGCIRRRMLGFNMQKTS